MKQALRETELESTGPVPLPATDTFRPDLFLGKIRLLWRDRSLLFRVTAWGAAVSLLAVLVFPSEYESTVRLMPPENQSSNSMAMMAALVGKAGTPGIGNLAGDLLGLKNSGELFVGILQSRTVQDRLIDRFDLRKVYGKKLMQDARKKLTNNTVITSDRKSGIITFTVTDHDPRRGAAMAEAYADELNKLVSELSTSGAHRERVFLENRLKTVEQDLETAEKDFSQFASKNMAIDIKEQGKAMVEAGAVLQGQLIAAESEMEGLRQIYSDNNVRVRSMQARIEELRQQLDKVGGKGAGTSAGEAASDSLYPSIKKLPLLGVTYADMYRQTKVQETVFEVLTQQYELAKVQEVREIPSVKVLDPANTPEKRSFPPSTPVVVLVGGLLSFALGIFWILGKQRWEQMDSEHPVKVVALGLYGGARSHLGHAAQNGSRLGWAVRQARRFRRKPMAGETGEKMDVVHQEKN